MEQKILLDTNFLVAPFQMNISIFRELDEKFPDNELYTLDDVIEEAKSIESGRYGSLVQKLVETQGVEVLETEGEGVVDDLIFRLSDEFVVATNDKELKNRILREGRPVIYIRGSSYLEAENLGL